MQRAIKLDPNFAMAYAALGTAYNNISANRVRRQSSEKRHTICATVRASAKSFTSTRTTTTSSPVTLEKARQAYESWSQSYPRDEIPYTNLGSIDARLGRYEKSLAEAQQAFQLNPSGLNYSNLVTGFLCLDRFDEARVTAEEAQARKLDSPYLRAAMYQLAFLKNDQAGMAQDVAWASGKPGVEDTLLAMEADTAAYSRAASQSAEELTVRAVASAIHADEKETAATYEAQAGLRQALFGNSTAAKQHAARPR